MATIIKFADDAENWYDRGREKAVEGNYVDAIDCFHQALRREPDCYWIYEELYESYFAMGDIDAALNTCHKLILLDPKDESGYLGAVQCRMRQNDMDGAVYYLGMGVANGAVTPDTELRLPEAVFKAVQSKRCDIDLEDIDGLLEEGNGAAIRILASLMAGKSDSMGICGNIAAVELAMGSFEMCAEHSEMILAKMPQDVDAHCTAMLAYEKLGRHADAQRHLDAMKAMNITDVEEMYRLAASCMTLGWDDLAYGFFTKAHRMGPYHKSSGVGYALYCYDAGLTAEAKKTFVELRKLYPDDTIVSFYARHVSEGKLKYIPADVDIPGVECVRRERRLLDVFNDENDDDYIRERLVTDEELCEYARWSLPRASRDLATYIGARLCRLPEWQPYIRDLFLDRMIDIAIKRDLLTEYLLYAEHKNFAICDKEIFVNYDPHIPAVEAPPELREAYFVAYATYAVFKLDFDEKIGKAYRSIAAAANERGVALAGTRREALAAYIAYITNDRKIFKRIVDCCEIFECTESEFRNIRDMFRGVERVIDRKRGNGKKRAAATRVGGPKRRSGDKKKS